MRAFEVRMGRLSRHVPKGFGNGLRIQQMHGLIHSGFDREKSWTSRVVQERDDILLIGTWRNGTFRITWDA